MALRFKFDEDEGFWTAQTKIEALKTTLKLLIYVDDPSARPSRRQREVAARIGGYVVEAWNLIQKSAGTYCRQTDETVDLQEEGIVIDYAEITQHFQLQNAIVSRLDGTREDYFFLSCECDWEEEHGMQLVMNGSTVLGCGGCTGAFIMTHDDDTYRNTAKAYE